MLISPKCQLHIILDFLGLSKNSQVIETALQWSSKENMHMMEKADRNSLFLKIQIRNMTL